MATATLERKLTSDEIDSYPASSTQESPDNLIIEALKSMGRKQTKRKLGKSIGTLIRMRRDMGTYVTSDGAQKFGATLADVKLKTSAHSTIGAKRFAGHFNEFSSGIKAGTIMAQPDYYQETTRRFLMSVGATK